MSRHELAPLDETISCVFVGWDKGLGSYFFQMYRADNDSEFDVPDDELGGDFAQVTSHANIIDEVRKYADIPADLSDQLAADKAREGTCEVPLAVSVMNTTAPGTVWDDRTECRNVQQNRLVFAGEKEFYDPNSPADFREYLIVKAYTTHQPYTDAPGNATTPGNMWDGFQPPF